MSRSTATDFAIIGFPGLGIPNRSGTWKILISGFVLSPPASIGLRQRMLLRMLGGLMRATPEEMSSSILQNRVRPFLSEGESRRKIQLQIGDYRTALRKTTRKNGHFSELCKVDAEQIVSHIRTSASGACSLPFQVFLEDNPESRSSGTIHLLKLNGTSVISDIDDTIKVSGVVDRRELLANTFLKEFRSVEGMADVYQRWANLGADFHYVSSSPWQLYEPLLEMKNRNSFPVGTIHLKNFRFRDQFFQRMKLKRHGKSTTIRFLMNSFPDRQFVLIGDSGEKDPEIYAKICRKFPNQVKGVFIRDLPKRPLDADRHQHIQAAMDDRCLFQKFRTSEELCSASARLF
jgi:phosphatidate phosphatase APP1